MCLLVCVILKVQIVEKLLLKLQTFTTNVYTIVEIIYILYYEKRKSLIIILFSGWKDENSSK